MRLFRVGVIDAQGAAIDHQVLPHAFLALAGFLLGLEIHESKAFGFAGLAVCNQVHVVNVNKFGANFTQVSGSGRRVKPKYS